MSSKKAPEGSDQIAAEKDDRRLERAGTGNEHAVADKPSENHVGREGRENVKTMGEIAFGGRLGLYRDLSTR